MEFAIIAAGEGSRLRSEGFTGVKPMVMLQEQTLVERLINIFERNGATAVHIIINEESPELYAHLKQVKVVVPINIIVKTTPSSLHSFYEIIPFVQDDAVCLTTVDTVFHETEFTAYIKAFKTNNALDGLMAATNFIDDEKPLYLLTDDSDNIIAYADDALPGAVLVSGGVYCLRRSVFPMVNEVVAAGASRMRFLQKQIVENGYKLKAHIFSKIIDIDHVSDIDKATAFLEGQVLIN